MIIQTPGIQENNSKPLAEKETQDTTLGDQNITKDKIIYKQRKNTLSAISPTEIPYNSSIEPEKQSQNQEKSVSVISGDLKSEISSLINSNLSPSFPTLKQQTTKENQIQTNSQQTFQSQSSSFISQFGNLKRINSGVIAKYNDCLIGRRNSTLYAEILENQFQIQSNIYTFKPDSWFKIIWDFFLILLILWQALYVPFKVSFDDVKGGSSKMDIYGKFQFFIDIVFLCDIIVTANTGFYNKGSVILNRKKIIKKYLKFWFWVDFISSFPYSWIFEGIMGTRGLVHEANFTRAPQLLKLIRIIRFLKILRLLRLLKLKRLLFRIEELFLDNFMVVIFGLCRLIVILLFIAHWIACMFYLIAYMQSESDYQTWIDIANVEDSSNDVKYITSLYWAFTTMTTVGYGDVRPSSTSEKIFAIFVMGIASGIFALIVGSISNFINQNDITGYLINEKFKAANKFMKRKKLSRELQFKIKRYLEYIFKESKQTKVEDDEIIEWLSEPLKFEINSYIYGIRIKKTGLFDSFDQNILFQLSKILTNVIFAPDDVLFEEGECSSHMFFIKSGFIQIFDQQTHSNYAVLGETEFFGEIAFFSGLPRCASARCIDFAELSELDFVNFQSSILQRFPEALKTFDHMQQKMKDAGDFSDIKIRCYVCNKVGHTVKACDKIIFSLDSEKLKSLAQVKYKSQVIKPGQNTSNYARKIKKLKKVIINENAPTIQFRQTKKHLSKHFIPNKIKKSLSSGLQQSEFKQRSQSHDQIFFYDLENMRTQTPDTSLYSFCMKPITHSNSYLLQKGKNRKSATGKHFDLKLEKIRQKQKKKSFPVIKLINTSRDSKLVFENKSSKESVSALFDQSKIKQKTNQSLKYSPDQFYSQRSLKTRRKQKLISIASHVWYKQNRQRKKIIRIDQQEQVFWDELKKNQSTSVINETERKATEADESSSSDEDSLFSQLKKKLAQRKSFQNTKNPTSEKDQNRSSTNSKSKRDKHIQKQIDLDIIEDEKESNSSKIEYTIKDIEAKIQELNINQESEDSIQQEYLNLLEQL